MTKSELIERLAKHYPQLVVQDAQVVVRTILDALAESVTRGQRVEIRGFGSFGLNYRPPRSGRNPKSGQKVQVPAKYVPHFKVAKNYAIGTRSINYFLARKFLRDLRHNFGKEIKKRRETQGVCMVWDLLTWMSSESSAKY